MTQPWPRICFVGHGGCHARQQPTGDSVKGIASLPLFYAAARSQGLNRYTAVTFAAAFWCHRLAG